MRIGEIFKRTFGVKNKTTCLTKTQVNTITTPANMEQVSQEVEKMLPKKAVHKRVSTASKSSTKNTAAKSRRYSKIIKNEEDLKRELRAATNRINYLRNYKAKELGVGIRKVTKTPEKAPQRPEKVKERDRNYHFYRFWLREHKDTLASKYINLKAGMVNSAEIFTAFHRRLWAVTEEFGSEEDRKLLNDLAAKEVE